MRNELNNILASSVFAEEALVVDVQTALHHILEKSGLSRADLARRMDVSRARVTQMFSDECPNLTLRLVARAFHALGETVEISCKSTRDQAKQVEQEFVQQTADRCENVVLGNWAWQWETDGSGAGQKSLMDDAKVAALDRALACAEELASASQHKKARERRPRAEEWLVGLTASPPIEMAVANG